MQNCVNSTNVAKKFNLSNLDSESIVIGSLLNNTVEIEEVLLYLRPEDFFGTVNQKIFACMIDLHQKGLSIDPNIVLEELEKERKSNEVFSNFDVNEFFGTVSKYTMTGRILETHCRSIKDNSLRRSIVEFANSVNHAAVDKSTDLGALIDQAQSKMNSMGLDYKTSSIHNAADIDQAIIDDIESRNSIENDYIESGFSGLDRIIKGFKKSNFVIVGARPNVGKTAFALNIANNLCKQGISVGFFSIEVSSKSLMIRCMAINSCVEYDKIRNNKFMNENERQKCFQAHSKTKNFKMFINDTYGIRIHELKAEARKMKKNYGVDIIFIDYIGLITVEHRNTPRFEQVAFLSKNLRELARELDIPIIALSQLNRDAEGRVPNLANLRESGALEQDSDIVIFLHREDEEQQDNDEEVRKVKVIVAKNRHGAIGIATIGFEPKYTKFMDVGVG